MGIYKEKKHLTRISSRGKLLIAMVFMVAVPLAFVGRAYADSCSSGFLCRWDVTNYEPTDECITSCPKTNPASISEDQPILLWKDNPTHDFIKQGNPIVAPGQTI